MPLGIPCRRTLVLSALIAVMPFSGMRVICIDSPADPGSTSPVAQTETGSECERLCPLHKPATARSAPSSSSENESDCALSPDSSFVSSVFAGVAVSRPADPLQVPQAVAAVYADPSRFHLEPELAHLAPPPKPQAF